MSPFLFHIRGAWKMCDDAGFIDLKGRPALPAVALVMMCATSYLMGANDAANSWGTAIGSGAIKMNYALVFAGIFEFLGASTLGYGVSSQIIESGVQNITDQDCIACGSCDSSMTPLAGGMLGALAGASCFLLISTIYRMPVSTTHAIISGLVGVTAYLVGWDCIGWSFTGLGGVVLSWLVSPMIAGGIATLLYCSTEMCIQNKLIPPVMLGTVLVFCSLLATVSLTLFRSPLTKEITTITAASISVSVAIFVSFLFGFVFAKPLLTNSQSTPVSQAESAGAYDRGGDDDATESSAKVLEGIPLTDPARGSLSVVGGHEDIYATVFRQLLVLTAALESFAHGSNDTANATAPFTFILQVYEQGSGFCVYSATEPWVLCLAGFSVALGVWTFGHRVVKTIGSDIAPMNFHAAWSVEFSSASTVLLASSIGCPISSTHCQVGAVFALGILTRSDSSVNWPLLGKIGASWLLTIPLSMIMSIVITFGIRGVLKN